MKSHGISAQVIALAIVVLVAGLAGTDLAYRDWLAFATMRSALLFPNWGALVPLAGAICLAAMRQRVAAAFCAIGTIALAARDVLLEAQNAIGEVEPAARAMLALSCLFLAVGTLVPPRTTRGPRIVAALAPALVGAAICLTLAFVILLSYSSWRNASGLLALSAAQLALSVIWLRHALREFRLPTPLALARLVVPIALAVPVGIGVAAALLLQLPGLEASQIPAWIACFAIVSSWTTITLILAISRDSRVLALEQSGAKLRRILGRQRRIMHKRAAGLRQSRKHFETLFRNVPTPVALTAQDGAIRAANPAMIALLGCESETQLRTMNIARFYANPHDRDVLVSSWAASDTETHQGEVEMRRLDGSRRVVLYAIRSVRGPDGKVDYLQGTMTDITDFRVAEANRQKLETSLRLSQKLESVGRLAAGIAHEINTPMQYIGDNVYFLDQAFQTLTAALDGNSNRDDPAALTDDAELHSIRAEIPGALERTREGIATVSHIVAAMKELAHPGQGAKVSVDINAIVDTALTVTRNAYKTVALVKTELAALPPIPAYKNELSQVVINLIVNAAQAIESRGIFGEISIATFDRGLHVEIRIKDNGCGIPQAAIEKIFDPFFTTKALGHGTGQGLSIARTIVVDKHDGDIAVESTPGAGTEFVITLPVRMPEPGADVATKEKLS